MAGLFEGEGCVMHYHYPGHTQRGLTLGMTDLGVVEKFARLAECGTITPRPYSDGRKTMHYWMVRRWNDVWPLLMMLMPLMSERRAAAMQALLDDPPREPNDTCEVHNELKVIVPGDTARRCRSCRREYARGRR